MRSASGDKRGGAGAGGSGGNVTLEALVGGLVGAEVRDFNGESYKRENIQFSRVVSLTHVIMIHNEICYK